MAPASAAGQDGLSNPTEAQYEPQSQIQGTNTTGGGGGGGPVAANTSNSSTQGGSGTLPFTGMDLVVVAGTALTLIASGFVIRKLSAPRAPGT
jgi:hypothetical protein